ncbi:MAG: hypothetical protein JXB13_21415 [Phycisphaerae bacterium]|nr:hypothetical protein [Phycisphaerae bacterium]
MSRTSFIVLIVGAVLIFGGVVESLQSSKARQEPQEITCADLTRDGYGDNAHVRLTDFYLCDSTYVVEERIQWEKVWIPAVPRGSRLHEALENVRPRGNQIADILPGRDIRLIVLLKDVRSQKDVERAAARDVIQGMLISPMRGFSKEQRRLLQQSYPGLSFDRCLILVDGRKPATRTKTALLVGAGVTLMLVGGFLAYRERQQEREADWTVVNPND